MNACHVNFRCFLNRETTALAQRVGPVQMSGTYCYKIKPLLRSLGTLKCEWNNKLV